MTQFAMNQCAGSDLRQSKKRLDQLLAELRPTLDSSRRAGLDRAEHRWATYVAAHCTWESSRYEGGSMQPMVHASCLAAEMETRINTLKRFLCDVDEPADTCEAAKKYDLPKQS